MWLCSQNVIEIAKPTEKPSRLFVQMAGNGAENVTGMGLDEAEDKIEDEGGGEIQMGMGFGNGLEI